MNIEITVANRIAAVVGSPVIVCGNKGYTVTFSFDREWDGYDEKTARFVFIVDGKAKFIDVLFSGNTCDAPMLSNISQVTVGVYAGDLRTTTGATIKCLKSILCGGGAHEEPPEDVYNKILEEVSTKLSSSGGTLTGNFFLDGNEFIHEGNLYLLEPYFDNVLNGRNITETASGSAITIDSAKAPLQNLKLYGKTTQNGTPTPDAPVPLVSVGDSGSFEVGVYGRNLAEFNLYSVTNAYATVITNKSEICIPKNTTLSITATFEASQRMQLYWFMDSGLFPNNIFLYIEQGTNTYTRTFTTTKDVKVAPNQRLLLTKEAGTVTALNCQLEIGTQATPYEPCNKQTLTMPYTLCGESDNTTDELDLTKGVFTRKFVRFVADGSENWVFNSSSNRCFQLNPYELTGFSVKRDFGKSSHFIQKINTDAHFFVSGGTSVISIYDFNNKWADLAAFKTWLSENNVTFVLPLETPIETPLTETELNAYRQLYTNKGTTTILSEAEADVVYYPNNECAQAVGNVHSEMRSMMNTLTQAIISVGGAE